MTNIPVKISNEIKDKYSIVSNAFRLAKVKNAELDIYKNEPKDEINVEIGDTVCITPAKGLIATLGFKLP
jgi:hypothetical protein